MTFLEAQRIVSGFAGGDELSFLLATSGTANPFEIFLRAAAAKLGHSVRVRTPSFNTLSQLLRQKPQPEEIEVFLLLPWDLAPETDWRSGLPSHEIDPNELRQRADVSARLLRERKGARLLYLPAPIPPIFPDCTADLEFANYLGAVAASLNARLLSADSFSLSSFLASGCPVGGAFLGDVADAIIQEAHSNPHETHKVLITDLDHCLWHGVVAEDGLEGIQFEPEGRGYAHFIYQTFLAKLKREGVLLAAVSRNDPDIGLGPLHNAHMPLNETDFVRVACSYDAKSAQIRNIARQLNVGLDSFVFVDDNPVELAEVSTQLPQVFCLQFPSHDEGLVQFVSKLARLFARTTVTAEDRGRTDLYRRRLESMTPEEFEGADITEFLRGLQMTLTVHDRVGGGHERAVQLINKTNQFNMNGRRITPEEITLALNAGAHLYTAALNDRTGAHGEILACLVSPEGVIQSFVMSCRVFERRLEHAFLAWLASQAQAPCALEFISTARNEPFRRFLKDAAFELAGNLVKFDATQFAATHSSDLALFTLKVS